MPPCHPIDLSFRVSFLMSHSFYRVKLYLSRKCKAKVIGCSLIMFSIGVFIFSLPHLLSDEYLPMEEQESCHTECTTKLSSGKYHLTLSVHPWQTSSVRNRLFINLGVSWHCPVETAINLFAYPSYQAPPKSLFHYFSEILVQSGIFPYRNGKYSNGDSNAFLHMWK